MHNMRHTPIAYRERKSIIKEHRIMSRNLGSILSLTALAGVLSIGFAGQASAQELVTNGGFETGDFSGWTLSGNGGFIGITTNPVHSGQFAASFGAVGSQTFLTQTLMTNPGQVYDLSYWLRNSGGNPNEFSVSVDGVFLRDDFNVPGQPYTQDNFQFTASGASTVLQFGFRQDPSFWQFDDVSVTSTVPEPGSIAMIAGMGVTGSLFAFARLRRRRK